MKELLEGRRLGFAPRPHLATLALGLGVAVTLLDLMSWFAWGARDTNGFLIGATWVAGATAVAALLGFFTALAEWRDAPEEETSTAKLDLAAAGLVILLYLASTALRATDLSLAAATPAAFLLAIAGLIVLGADSVIAGNLYSAREWEEVEEEHRPARDRGQQRRRAAARSALTPPRRS